MCNAEFIDVSNYRIENSNDLDKRGMTPRERLPLSEQRPWHKIARDVVVCRNSKIQNK